MKEACANNLKVEERIFPKGAGSGNVAQSAEHLQTPKRTLYNKLSRHAIIAKQFRG